MYHPKYNNYYNPSYYTWQDDTIQPEEFTNQLQKELNSSPQPCLVPFLKKSLPYLRYSLIKEELTIDGVRAPHANAVTIQANGTAIGNAQAAAMAGNLQMQAHMQQQAVQQQQQQQQQQQLAQLQHLQSGQRGPMGQVRLIAPPGTTLAGHPMGGLGAQQIITQLPPNVSGPIVLSSGAGPIFTSSSGHVTLAQNHLAGSPLTRLPTLVQQQHQSPSMNPIVSSHLQQAQLPTPQLHQQQVAHPSPTPTPPVRATTPSKPKAPSKSKSAKAKAAEEKKNAAAAAAAAAAASIGPGGMLFPPGVTPGTGAPGEKSTSSFRDDDDINDVAAMGGVNLQEESQRLAGTAEIIGQQIRSCKDEPFLAGSALAAKINSILKRYELTDCSQDVVALISHAVEERLKTIVEKLGVIAEHRQVQLKNNMNYEMIQDVKAQVQFLQELDRNEKKRHEEQEREVLIRAAKSRSKVDDPDQIAIKARAKELQRQEMEELRQREANETALQAIGFPKKRLKTGPGSGTGSSGGGGSASGAGSGSGLGTGGSSGSSGGGLGMLGSSLVLSGGSGGGVTMKRKIRVSLKDVTFLLEEERDMKTLYKIYAR